MILKSQLTKWWRSVIIIVLPLAFILLQGCEPTQKITGFWQLTSHPKDLAWDGSNLWVLNSEKGIIQRMKPNTERVTKFLRVPVQKPEALTFDGQHFWALDRENHIVRRFDSQSGKILREIKPPFLESLGDQGTVTGMTHNAGYLWISVSAGWCSTLKCIDTTTGKEVLSVFPQCDPYGLASDNQSIWTVAYNGEKLPAKLSKWAVSTDHDRFKQSQQVLIDLQIRKPGGMTYAEGSLWIADQATGKIIQLRTQ